ncbi:mannuronan 5-epimerase AlgG [Pseudomonas sp. R5(2019)]|uniref:mannuronan 5-epimerase AlgG n=1 Tax=Pseudomonas sp. R5(2019) TaxID=2697566 RepID=UPI001412EF9E|nr:mannuronan 5-epimerase AlgG [Pseudomonas sp. R5(2019)]NBA94860.1 right-handed parallel beta-helix repeat-containing protein [Pseudomonas sp. R5(2019)]
MDSVVKIGLLLATLLWGQAQAVSAAQGVSLPRYTISEAPGKSLLIKEPKMPDLSGYTAEAAMAKIVYKPAGRALIQPMLKEQMLDEFIGGKERIKEWVVRQKRMPVAIFIDRGYMNLSQLARSLPPTALRETAPGVFLARLPIVIRPGATLHVDKSVKELRLSQEGGSFLVNDGKLFITDTKVSAWSEKNNSPAWYKKEGVFRPFLVSWGGTQTYIVNSTITSFGYTASKSYGVSISQYSPSMAPKMKRKRPTGWLINSEFVDNWYGFYCYEADDVVILGNRYRDNIVYGIDPHDRSRRLIIAHNDAFGTRKKHGIIVSREVNDSWIIHNRAYENGLSGIVLDRSSVNNLVAYNEAYKNRSDGITLYESGNNLLWRNRAVNNDRHGIRVRNSTRVKLYENELMANVLTGIYGHIKDLRGTDRNLHEDPFEAKLSLTVVGGKLIGNGSSPITVFSPSRLELYDLTFLAPQKQDGLSFSGLLGEVQGDLIRILLNRHEAALIVPMKL